MGFALTCSIKVKVHLHRIVAVRPFERRAMQWMVKPNDFSSSSACKAAPKGPNPRDKGRARKIDLAGPEIAGRRVPNHRTFVALIDQRLASVRLRDDPESREY